MLNCYTRQTITEISKLCQHLDSKIEAVSNNSNENHIHSEKQFYIQVVEYTAYNYNTLFITPKEKQVCNNIIRYGVADLNSK